MAILSILLTTIIVIASILLVLVVLVQRPKQEGLGAAFGGGAFDSALGAHTTDILQKITCYIAIVFFVSAIGLAMVKSRQFAAAPSNVLEGVEKAEEANNPTPILNDAATTLGTGDNNSVGSVPSLPSPNILAPGLNKDVLNQDGPAPAISDPAPATTNPDAPDTNDDGAPKPAAPKGKGKGKTEGKAADDKGKAKGKAENKGKAEDKGGKKGDQ